MNLATKLFAVLATTVVATSASGNYQVDASHTQVSFKVKHLGLANVTGHFELRHAAVDFDGSDFTTLSAEAVIDAASVDTRDDDRDKHLKSADFLAVDDYPEIRFVSTKAEVLDAQHIALHGELTIRGVTKNVILDTVVHGPVTGPMGKERTAFVASTTVDRKDFGVSWNKVLDAGGLVVGNEVRIEIELEAIHADSTD